MKKGFNKKLRLNHIRAFTLAEVLITLGIIGVVAAMTIPTLIGNINDIRFRSQFFKSYSLLKQTLKSIINDGDSPLPDREDKFYLKYKNHFSNATDCGDHLTKSSGTGCYNFSGISPYVAMDGNTKINYELFDDGSLLMPDGSLFLFENPANTTKVSDAFNEKYNPNRLWIWVDVNSVSKQPNRLGYDLFVFQITSSDDELKPMGQSGTDYSDTTRYCNKNGTGRENGMSCAYKLAQNPHSYYKWLRRKGD